MTETLECPGFFVSVKYMEFLAAAAHHSPISLYLQNYFHPNAPDRQQQR